MGSKGRRIEVAGRKCETFFSLRRECRVWRRALSAGKVSLVGGKGHSQVDCL